jgi:hypothetical protein
MKHCPACQSPRVASAVVWLPFRPYRRDGGKQPARVAQEHNCVDCQLKWSTYYGPFGLVR